MLQITLEFDHIFYVANQLVLYNDSYHGQDANIPFVVMVLIIKLDPLAYLSKTFIRIYNSCAAEKD